MKFARGTANNLETLIIHDLKDIGIKVPKLRKTVDQQNVSETSHKGNGVFGLSLNALSFADAGCYGDVPKFLVDIIDLIEKDVDVEGIFRRSGSVVKLKELRARIDGGELVLDASVFDFASLLKQFLRELPEPLLTARLQDTFLHCYNLSQHVSRVFAILHLCHLLPDCNRQTLQYLCTFLQRVTERSDFNKMDATNLAICLAPNIFHPSTSCVAAASDAAKSLLTAQAGVIELLIEHASDIGVVTDDLSERVSLMATCFSDSAFDDCEVEGTETREKKRSGSFQDFVSSLSSSFTKRRHKDRHNISAVAVSSSCQDITNVDVISVAHDSHTPHLRKRPAEEPLAFSTGKRQAILQQMPLKSVLGSTPYTPSTRKGKFAELGVITPSFIMSTKEGDFEQKYDSERSLNTSGTKLRRGNSLESSPNYATHANKSKVRKSFEGLIRRLSGSKDTQVQQRLDSYKPESVIRDGCMPQRSPSAPSFRPLFTDADRVSCQSDVENDIVADRQKTSRRQRSLSADGSLVNTSLRRGRPNSIKSGLQLPANRLLSESLEWRIPAPSCDNDQLPAIVLDTSPIAKELNSHCVNSTTEELDEDSILSRQISKDSLGSLGVDESMDDALDQAFIGSILDTDNIVTTIATSSDLNNTASSVSSIADDEEYTYETNAPAFFLGTECDVAATFAGEKLQEYPRRPVCPTERYVSRPERLPNQAPAMGSNSVGPKIKPSLMSDSMTSRLLNRAACSPRLMLQQEARLSTRQLFARSEDVQH